MSHEDIPAANNPVVIETFRPHQMSDSEMKELADLVRKPFTWYAPGSTTQDIFSLLRGRGESYVDIAFNGDSSCGFLASESVDFDDTLVCYHIGVSLDESVRGKHLYTRLTDLSLTRGRFDYLAARTQNPAVYEALSRYAINGAIYPAENQSPPSELVPIARELSGQPNIEIDTFAVRGLYGYVREDRTYMKARSQHIQDFFSNSLERDDGFMVIASLKP